MTVKIPSEQEKRNTPPFLDNPELTEAVASYNDRGNKKFQKSLEPKQMGLRPDDEYSFMVSSEKPDPNTNTFRQQPVEQNSSIIPAHERRHDERLKKIFRVGAVAVTVAVIGGYLVVDMIKTFTGQNLKEVSDATNKDKPAFEDKDTNPSGLPLSDESIGSVGESFGVNMNTSNPVSEDRETGNYGGEFWLDHSGRSTPDSENQAAEEIIAQPDSNNVLDTPGYNPSLWRGGDELVPESK